MQTFSRRSFLRSSALAAPFLFLPRLRAAEAWEANDLIQKHRRAALAVLKPTPAQLDRGLKLHAESLVFDTYGFAPRCAVDGAAPSKLAAENASAIELKDAGILYIPDFVASAGAMIVGVTEVVEGKSAAHARLVGCIYETTRLVIEESKKLGTSTLHAAETLAAERMGLVGSV